MTLVIVCRDAGFREDMKVNWSSATKRVLAQLGRGRLIAVLVIGTAVLGAICYVSFIASAPDVPPATRNSKWTLLVDGLVQHPLNLSLGDIVAMPKTTINADLYCLPSPGSSGVLIDSGNWTGVPLRYILEQAGVSPEAVKVAFYAQDGFTTDLPLTKAMEDGLVLAYEKDDESLIGAIRLTAPGMWGYKWINWLVHIEVVNYDFKGTYESRGFPDNAEIP